MITLKLTQKQTNLIIHSLGSEAIRLNDDTFTAVRDNLLAQLESARKLRAWDNTGLKDKTGNEIYEGDTLERNKIKSYKLKLKLGTKIKI